MAKQRGSRPAGPAPGARAAAADEYVARHPRGVVVLGGDEVILIGPEGPPVAIRAGDPWAFAAVLRASLQPVPARELSTPPVREAFEALVETGLLVRAASADAVRRAVAEIAALVPATLTPARPICRHMVVCAAGAIQTMNLPKLLFSALIPLAERIDVVLTEAAQRFVATDALAALGVHVWTDPSPTESVPVPHVHLAGADLVVMTPATAASLHRIAAGACSDLSSLIAAMTRAPVVLVPAMNEAMWDNPAVGRNARQVVADGNYLVLPGTAIEAADVRQATSSFGGVGVPEHRYGLVVAAVLEHARSRSGAATHGRGDLERSQLRHGPA